MLTKLLAEMGTLGCNLLPNQLRMEQTTKKELKDKIDAFLEQPKKSSMNAYDSDVEIVHQESTYDRTIEKKSPEIKMEEDEYEALMNRSLMIRRGRNNMVYAKYIEKEIFEDPEISDSEDYGEEKKVLKKRKKKYTDVGEYLRRELKGFD